eukprot:jgi/Mesen1/10987/ME000097S10565
MEEGQLRTLTILGLVLSVIVCSVALDPKAATLEIPLHVAPVSSKLQATSNATDEVLTYQDGPILLKKGSKDYLQLFVAETQFYNDLVLFFLPKSLKDKIPHTGQTWLRNYVAGMFVYFATGGLWCWTIYRNEYFLPKEAYPSREAIWKQIVVSMQSTPLYVSLPTLSEYMIEQGWTKCYSRISEVGIVTYLLLFAAYMIFVEAGIYCMHRGLHDIKPLYKLLHATHHIYNKQNTLSPFAGLAFHPLDGILQASPHVFALFIIPQHFLTHEIMLFLEAVWTTNIHDCIDEKIFPLMGAGYHTIHHTTYRHNYGHYTIWMDWMFGTLKAPETDRSTTQKME